MYKALLNFHWQVARMPLLALTVGAFTVPLLSAQRWGWNLGGSSDAGFILSSMQMWAVAYPVVAGAAGLLLAVTAWSKDHRGQHVYALTLPVPRWQYTWLRYRAGLTLLAAPIAAVGIGSLMTAMATSVPDGLSVYPMALTLRFSLAAGVAFSVFFAISSGTTRTAGYVIGVLVAAIGGQVFLSTVGFDVNFLAPAIEKMFNWPGPLDVFGGRWMLIDV